MAEAPLLPHAGKWSDFVTVSTKGDVVVSYRQRMKKNGWMVEWRVENMSADWVQPFTKFRTYLCVDGTRHSLKEKTLGPYPPGDQGNGGIRDREICSGSEISTVEVEIELRAVSEIIRKMWE
jgi:hypothetical protein